MTQNFEAVKPTGRPIRSRLIYAFRRVSINNDLLLDWRKLNNDDMLVMPKEDGSIADIPAFEGDPSAGVFRIDHEQAAIVAVPRQSFEELKADVQKSHPGHRQAVAYRNGSGNYAYRAALLPEGINFGVEANAPGEYRMAKSLGKRHLYLAMGLWTPGELFIVPRDIRALGTAALAGFEDRHPETPLA